MKHWFLLVFFIVFVHAFNVQAQRDSVYTDTLRAPRLKQPHEDKERIVRVGLNVGVGFSNFITDDRFYNELNQWRFRFYAGVFQDIKLYKRLYLHTEVNYTSLGTMQAVDLADSSGTIIGKGSYKYNLHYIQVPALLKIKFGHTFKGYVSAGPYVGFLVAARGGIDPGSSTGLDYPQTNIVDDYTTIDIGLKLGGGIEIPILNDQTILFEFRYSQGFIDISKTGPRDWNGAFSLHAGYMFEL